MNRYLNLNNSWMNKWDRCLKILGDTESSNIRPIYYSEHDFGKTLAKIKRRYFLFTMKISIAFQLSHIIFHVFPLAVVSNLRAYLRGTYYTRNCETSFLDLRCAIDNLYMYMQVARISPWTYHISLISPFYLLTLTIQQNTHTPYTVIRTKF